MYKLIKSKAPALRVTLADSSDMADMITSGMLMLLDRPDLHLYVIDSTGTIVWPAA